MISGSLVAPTPLRDGIREEQGDDKIEAQPQSHIVPLVNAAGVVQIRVVCETDWQAMWAQKFKLRALNALHLASTLTFQANSGPTIPFITADVNQRKAADTFAINLIWVE